MKKLLSICFLSILLGLLSFSAQAQNCGFLIKNLQPDTIPTHLGIAEGVAQMSPDGLLPLEHTLGSGVFINPNDPLDYYGNANVGRTELYELFLCNTCNLDPKTKISLDWILQREVNGEWVEVNEHLSDYVEFNIYTLYSEINDTTGVCNRITWLGGRVPDAMGYCEQEVAPDMFHGITCNTPVNYPGAVPVGQGTPYSVLSSIGQLIPAMGMTPVYTEALDYFYYDFFSQTRTLLQLTWKQAGNYRLIMNVRKRNGGTAWNNLTWNENETTDFIGGHQSCCGEVLMSDTLTYPVFGKVKHAVCDNNIWEYGRPTFVFNEPDANGVYPNRNFDTLVVFGEVIGEGDCSVFETDSIHYVEFFVRHTPVMHIANDTLCKCATFTEDDLFDLATQDVSSPDHPVITIEWQMYNPLTHKYYWTTDVPSITSLNIPGINYFTVRQINTYDDTLDCVSEPVTFSVLFKEMTPPEINVPELRDFCLDAMEGVTINLSAEIDEECANTVKWYRAFNSTHAFDFNKLKNGTLPTANYFSSYLETATYIGSNDITVNLNDPMYLPSTNKDTVLYFFAVSYNDPTSEECPSPLFSFFTVNLHQTPVLQMVEMDSMFCPGSEVEMAVNVTTNDTDPQYTYKWGGDVTEVLLNGTRVEFVEDQTVTVGTSTSTIAAYPFSSEAKYNYTQQIYPKAALTAGEITKIAFQYASTTAVTKNNVKIYIGTTDNVSFNNSNKQWLEPGTLVYDGTLSFSGPAGWKEIELQNSFLYNGTQNLVITIDDQSGTSTGARYFNKTDASNSVMRSYGSNPITANSTKQVQSSRPNIRLLVKGEGYTTQAKTQKAYYQMDANDTCHTPYTASVYVIDGNGCKSAPVTFNYISNDTIDPVIVPNATAYTINDCRVTANNTPVINTVADLAAAFNLQITDNCNGELTITGHQDAYDTNDCEHILVRTYTIADHCGNTATFTQTVTAHDSDKPYFVNPNPELPPEVRMIPVRAANCTYNAPDKAAFVNAILGRVEDDCTEMTFEWLMGHADFYWENSELFGHIEAPNTTDLFTHLVGNQLTVKVIVEDACGNADTAMLLYFNRPDTLTVEFPSVSVDPANICLGETATFTFDPNQVKFDEDFELATPLTYAWSSLNGDLVFSDSTAVTTNVTPTVGDKTYFAMVTVTDAYGCTANSEYAAVFVKANPNIAIVKELPDRIPEPYCPTYGLIHLLAVDSATEAKIPNLSYTWGGESVNVNPSLEEASSIYVVPTLCDHIYTATVHVVDTIYGCVGDASLSVWVADTAGPAYYGDVISTTVQIEDSCRMYVPDYTQYLNNATLIDNCYPFSEITVLRQEPAAGSLMTEDTMVVVYVKTPCNETEYAITGKFFALVPDDFLHVSASVVPEAMCDPAEFNFTATPEHGIGAITYTWTKEDDDDFEVAGQTMTTIDHVIAGEDSTSYKYTVTAVDEMLCTATASVNVKVYKTIVDIDTITYPNVNCTAPWSGQLNVFHAPIGTHYELVGIDDNTMGFYMERISQVPDQDHQVTENTLIFNNINSGLYNLIVTTPQGCVSDDFEIYIRDARPTVTFDEDEVEAFRPTFCTNDNGSITIHVKPGYTYEVYDENDVLVAAPYTGLTVGTYRVVKTNINTRCIGITTIDVLPSITTMKFPVTSQKNTLCGDEEFNGEVAFTTTGWNYTVTDEEGEVIYEGLATTLDTLAEGDYNVAGVHIVTGCPFDTTVTVGNGRIVPSFTVTTTPNNYCENEDNIVNGKITISNAAGTYTYTVSQGDEIFTNLTALAAGPYNVYAIDALGCEHDTNVVIYDELYYPIVDSVKFVANTSCNPEVLAYNGAADFYISADVDNVIIMDQNNTCEYRLVMHDYYGDTWDGGSLTFAQEGTATQVFTMSDDLYTQTFTVALISGLPTTITYNPGSWSNEHSFELFDQNNEEVWSKGRYTMNITSTKSITPNCSSVDPVAAFNNKIQPYTIHFWNDDEENPVDITTTFTNSPAHFGGLNSGVYNYSVMSKFFCHADDSEVEVPQHEMPTLTMHSTPNTMCVGTYNHPGNGTIVMDSVDTQFGYSYYRDVIFNYSFYYAGTTPVEGFEEVDGYYPGTKLQVNYFDPLSYTMYHLVDSLYYVIVYDSLTGCDVYDTIHVYLGRDRVLAEAESTPNKNCKAPFDGTVTVTATAYKLNTESYNVDAVLAYKLVGTTVNYTTAFQLNPVFTGVPDGTFDLIVKDTTTGCEYPFEGAVVVAKTPSDIVITPTITPNHACEVEGEYTPWDGTLSAVASSEMFEGADWVYKFFSDDSLGVVWYKEADAAFSTTNAWDSLETGAYHVIAMDNVSGCSQDSIFAVPTENICVPEVAFESFNHNNKPFHFCLNTEDARICAIATTTNEECPATEYDYKWHVDCHDLNFTGECIDIATDEVHCCTYTVTVTSLATGCKTVAPITVCIDPINTIEYLVNDEPFLDNPRTVFNCVNKDVKIGIEPNGWAHAWWTNAHTTVMPDGDPEYDFIVGANTTKVDTMYSYCVNVIDTNGCPAMGVINLISMPVPVATVFDTACSCIEFTRNVHPYTIGFEPGIQNPEFPNIPFNPVYREEVCYDHFAEGTVEFEYTVDAKGYIHFSYTDTTFNGAVNGCDSVTIHNVTLMPTPSITGTVAYNFCEGTTIAEAINGLTIANANDTIIKIYGEEVELTDELEFSNCEMVEMTVMAISGVFNNNEDTCSFASTYLFIVNAAPEFTDDAIEVEDAYCANGEPTITPIPEFNCNYCVMSEEYGDIMVDYEDNCTLHLYVMETDHTVFADLGVVEGVEMAWTPRFAYDGKLLALVIQNTCGKDTVYAELDIDSTVITINPVVICEGEALDIDQILGKHYDDVTAYLRYVIDENMDIDERTVTYVPGDNFDADQDLCVPATEYAINDDLEFTAALVGGTSNPKFFANNGGTIRLYRNSGASHNGNTLTIVPTDADANIVFTGITINATSNNAPTGITVNGTELTKNGSVYTISDLNADHLTIQNNTTTSTSAGNLYITSMTINYEVEVENIAYDEVEYTPGTDMTMAENGAGLYVEVNGEVCDPIITNITTITVKPLPVLEIGDLEADLCYADAADALEDAILTVEHASAQGWLVPSTNVSWTEGFESGEIPSTWTVITNGEGSGWTIREYDDNYPQSAHSGNYATTAPSYDNPTLTAYHADNWLFTPAIAATVGSSLSFFETAQDFDYPDHYSVYVLNNNQVDLTATPVIDNQVSSLGWAQHTIDLTPYAGQTVYVAFRHLDYDQFFFNIDDVTLSAGYQEYATADALVEAIKDNANTDVYYYVQNECGNDIQLVGNVRILDELAVSVTPSPVTVCPNAVVGDVLSQITITKDLGNYDESETQIYYTATVNGQTYELNSTSVFPMGFSTGDAIKVILTTVQGVQNCGNGEAQVVVNFLTNGHVNPTYKAACDGDPLSAFIDAAPQWTGTVGIAQEYWVVEDEDLDHPYHYTSRIVDLDYVLSFDRDPWVRYVWVTDCGETFQSPWYQNLVINRAPEITQLVNQITICEGASIAETDLQLGVTYHGNQDKYETVYTLDGDAFDFDHVFETAGEYTLTVTIDDDGEACGTAEEEVTIIVRELPNPTVTGPERACEYEEVTFTATSGFDSYTFYIDGVAVSQNQTSNEFSTSFEVGTAGVDFYTVTVQVYDGYCSATAEEGATIRVTNTAQFIFKDMEGNETHEFTSTTGTGLQYTWMVGTECNEQDKLVYVEYDIYFNDQIISNSEIGEYFLTQTHIDEYGESQQWISSNTFAWKNGDQSQNGNTAYYNYAIANPDVSTAGNHFPNTNLGLTNVNVYDDLWMHFLGDREVTKTFVPFRLNGTYKVVYRLYSTDHADDFEHLYYEDNYHMGGLNYHTTSHLGGQNALVSTQNAPANLTLLAIDSITVTVDGENLLASETPNDEDIVTPEVAPVLSVENTQVAPDIEVWPNPAPAVTTTLKARVHNMNGDATVTLTSLTGKTVYTGKTYIDNDNYYFEFDVNGLTVGAYIMTVRTDADVVTKKVIVARKAQ